MAAAHEKRPALRVPDLVPTVLGAGNDQVDVRVPGNAQDQAVVGAPLEKGIFQRLEKKNTQLFIQRGESVLSFFFFFSGS